MRERVVKEVRRSVRMDDKHNHIHTSPLAFALTVSWLIFIALAQSHPQPPPCGEQSYICSMNVSAVFDPPWEQIPASQCNAADPSSLLSCHVSSYDNVGYESQNFTVKDIDNTTHTMKLMLRPPVNNQVCSPYFLDIYENFYNTLLLHHAPVHKIIIFENCSRIPNFPSKRNFTCGDNLYYFEEGYTEKEMQHRYPPLKDCKGSFLVAAAAPLDRYDDSDDGAGVLKFSFVTIE